VADAFTRFHQIKAALIAAGLHDEALAMDTALNTGCDIGAALGFTGNWRGTIQKRGFREAMALMKTSKSNCKNATNLIRELHRHRHDRQSGDGHGGKNAALDIISNATNGRIQSHTSYRKKFARV